MEKNTVDDLLAEVLCDYAVLRAQILALCDLLVRKNVLSQADVDRFLKRYMVERRGKVTKEFLQHSFAAMGFSEDYIKEALRVFDQQLPAEEKTTGAKTQKTAKPRNRRGSLTSGR